MLLAIGLAGERCLPGTFSLILMNEEQKALHAAYRKAEAASRKSVRRLNAARAVADEALADYLACGAINERSYYAWEAAMGGEEACHPFFTALRQIAESRRTAPMRRPVTAS